MNRKYSKTVAANHPVVAVQSAVRESYVVKFIERRNKN